MSAMIILTIFDAEFPISIRNPSSASLTMGNGKVGVEMDSLQFEHGYPLAARHQVGSITLAIPPRFSTLDRVY